jgi:hypothetical protein
VIIVMVGPGPLLEAEAVGVRRSAFRRTSSAVGRTNSRLCIWRQGQGQMFSPGGRLIGERALRITPRIPITRPGRVPGQA